MVMIIAQLVFDIKDKQQPERDPDRQPKDIKQTIPFIPLEIAQGDEKEVL
jgi:hypothetical protein